MDTTSTANLKRLESHKMLKQGYQKQKSLIKAALSNVDSLPKNKIIFDDTLKNSCEIRKTYVEAGNSSEKDKKTLFNESESEEEFEANFSVKEHFQDKEGQKVYSRYQRFLDNKSVENDVEPDTNHNEDISLEEEKKKEYAILEEVLGKKITRRAVKQITNNKSMLRFDPSQPEHSKYEIPKPPPEKKEKKRKRKNSYTEITDEKKADETAAPEVSKDVFYKVADNLKQTFEEKKEFSLLTMFGEREEKEEEMDIEITRSVDKFQQEKNPFKYDSSDDEDETKNDSINKVRNVQNTRSVTSWTDQFFFKLDDHRLQEGFDFVEKIKLDDKMEFTKLRRDLKGIVKAKVRNNLRKNKPFKKKLGGRRKKKAMKR